MTIMQKKSMTYDSVLFSMISSVKTENQNEFEIFF